MAPWQRAVVAASGAFLIAVMDKAFRGRVDVLSLMLAALGWNDLATGLAHAVLLRHYGIVVEGVVLAGELLFLDYELRIDLANTRGLTLAGTLVRLVAHTVSSAIRMEVV